jgi:N utilization substance protein A
VGERIRAIISEVKKVGSRVRIVLSRTSPDFVRALFELEVPEISEAVVEIKGISREAGHRTKIAVHSTDAKVDAVGACVGVKGSRIRIIVDELNGEKIDIVRWSGDTETYIVSALKPAEIAQVDLDEEIMKATVIVNEDQLSLAIGKHGQNVRLASQLVGWDIDVMSPEEEAPEEAVEEEAAAEAEVQPEGAEGETEAAAKTDNTEPSAPGIEEKQEQRDDGSQAQR